MAATLVPAATNPLFLRIDDGPTSSAPGSPVRDVPARHAAAAASATAAAATARRRRRRRAARCCRAVPWLPLLCTLLTAAGLAAFSALADRTVGGVLGVLTRVGAPADAADRVAAGYGQLRTALLAVMSACVGLLLLLSAARRQRQARALRRNVTSVAVTTGAPPLGGGSGGCTAGPLFSGATVALLLVLWLITALLVGLMCLTFATGAAAWAGDASATTALGRAAGALSVAAAVNQPLDEARGALARANETAVGAEATSAAVESAAATSSSNSNAAADQQDGGNGGPRSAEAAARAAAAMVRNINAQLLPALEAGSDRLGQLEAQLLPLLATATGNSTRGPACYSTCLNLAPLASLLPPGTDPTTLGTCVCAPPAIEELQRDLRRLWRDAAGAFAALALLLAAATWLLMHGAAQCVAARYDRRDARRAARERAAAAEAARLGSWGGGGWGRDAPSPGGGGAGAAHHHHHHHKLFDVRSDQAKQTQLLAPELTAGGNALPQRLSPTKAKQVLQQHQQQQHQQTAAAAAPTAAGCTSGGGGDVERPDQQHQQQHQQQGRTSELATVRVTVSSGAAAAAAPAPSREAAPAAAAGRARWRW